MSLVEHSSWQVKGEALLDEMLALMEVTAEDKQLLRDLQSEAVAIAPTMTEAFYARLFQHPNTAEYLQGAPMERLHAMVGQWFAEIFGGTYDQSYLQKRLEIGRIHVRVGLPVRYPLAMLDIIRQYGQQVALKSPHPQAASQAFAKLLSLDIAIFNQAYEDNQLAYLAELVGGERLARMLLTEEAVEV